MEVSEEYSVVVEKFSNTGTGIAKVDGRVVFVEGACIGDCVKIKITKCNKNYSLATITEIIKPSVYRVKPFCPMQKVCGACQLQHIDYEYQLE